MFSCFNQTVSMSRGRRKRRPLSKRLWGCMKPMLCLFQAPSQAWRGCRYRSRFPGGNPHQDFPVQGGFHALQLGRGNHHQGNLASPFDAMGFAPDIRLMGSVKRLKDSQSSFVEYSNHFRHSPSIYTRSLFMKGGNLLEISDVPLGRGGFGSVFVGRLTDPYGDSTMVAVKNTEGLALMDSYSTLFEEKRIYDILATDPHPNIVKYYGCSPAHNGRDSLIVLEYIPGTLHYLIYEDPEFNSYSQMFTVLHGIASALEHLHKHKIIHFDLKPLNVLVTDDMEAKVTDFGVSKFRLNRSITVSPRGTLPYIAPECRANAWLNSASLPEKLECFSVTDTVDIFSFGMLALACVTGNIKRPDSSAKLMIAGGEFVEVGGYEKIMEPCDCPEELRSLISDCLRFNPNALDTNNHGRPSATELKNRLYSMQMRPWASDQLTWIAL